MPAPLALLLIVAFVLYLLRCDIKQSSTDGSWALCVPLAWLFFAGSRFPSRWLTAVGIDTPLGTELDGSPLDRWVFFALIAAAIVILRSRSVDKTRLLVRNKWVWLYFLFGAISVFWSVDPMVSLKRVAKALGNVIMALVILTEERPFPALAVVLRRLAYLTLPMSILLIRYFPAIGRSYTSLGAQQVTGVATQKNALGGLCLLAGICSVWSLLYESGAHVRLSIFKIRVEWFLLAIASYLLLLASSATSFLCLVVASVVLWVGSLSSISTPLRLATITIVVAFIVTLAESATDVSTLIIHALGRRTDLTTRVPMWQELLRTSPGNWLLGVGFEAYWLTRTGASIFLRWPVGNAHNGYLDTYLSSGLIGLFVLLASIATAIRAVARLPSSDHSSAVLRLCLLVVVVLYNWTESAFRSVSAIWTIFFIAGMDVQTCRAEAARALRPLVSKRPFQKAILAPAARSSARHASIDSAATSLGGRVSRGVSARLGRAPRSFNPARRSKE